MAAPLVKAPSSHFLTRNSFPCHRHTGTCIWTLARAQACLRWSGCKGQTHLSSLSTTHQQVFGIKCSHLTCVPINIVYILSFAACSVEKWEIWSVTSVLCLLKMRRLWTPLPMSPLITCVTESIYFKKFVPSDELCINFLSSETLFFHFTQ